jgi:hypothetical protein
MEMKRLVLETDLGDTTGPHEPRLTTAEIVSSDGRSLFNSVFHNGTPPRHPPIKGRKYETEAEARAGHDELVRAVRSRPAVNVFSRR